MTATALPPLRPITDIQVGIDALLDARFNLTRVQESTLCGTALAECMTKATTAVDAAIVDLRKAQG